MSRPDLVQRILGIKKLAVEAAKNDESDEAEIQSLQKEFERYQTGAEARVSSDSAALCPCNIGDRIDYCLCTTDGMTSIWDSRQHKRTLDDIKSAAISGNCQLCGAIVAMTRCVIGDETFDGLTVESSVMLDDGTCRPEWLRLEILQDGFKLATVTFQVSMEDASSGQ